MEVALRSWIAQSTAWDGASRSGDGACMADIGVGDMRPLGTKAEGWPLVTMAVTQRGRNVSANHSYQTFRLSVSRHSETCNSQSAGT